MRREVDDLALMDAEDAVHAPRRQQRQVGERAEAAVAREGVAAEDLVEEQVEDGDGVEGALAPGMLDVAADGDDFGPVELPGRGVADLSKDADESMMHGCLLPGDADSLFTAGGEIMFKSLA